MENLTKALKFLFGVVRLGETYTNRYSLKKLISIIIKNLIPPILLNELILN